VICNTIAFWYRNKKLIKITVTRHTVTIQVSGTTVANSMTHELGILPSPLKVLLSIMRDDIGSRESSCFNH
jgi:hypothetical protein